jgi:hypothetical protein
MSMPLTLRVSADPTCAAPPGRGVSLAGGAEFLALES